MDKTGKLGKVGIFFRMCPDLHKDLKNILDKLNAQGYVDAQCKKITMSNIITKGLNEFIKEHEKIIK